MIARTAQWARNPRAMGRAVRGAEKTVLSCTFREASIARLRSEEP